MGQSVFHFKQFSIYQEKSAMKVCTDSCVFGAWIPLEGAHRILDIGSGTGLLSLMMAQRSEAFIEAIEPHLASFEESIYNINQSAWANRIQVFFDRIESFKSNTPFDLIVSNPPFFVNHLKSTIDERNQAWHEDAMPMEVLAKFAKTNCTQNGKTVVLYPVKEADQFKAIMTSMGWYLIHRLSICKQEGDVPFRVAQVFAREAKPLIEETLALKIRTSDLATAAFKRWLEPYYAKAIK